MCLQTNQVHIAGTFLAPEARRLPPADDVEPVGLYGDLQPSQHCDLLTSPQACLLSLEIVIDCLPRSRSLRGNGMHPAANTRKKSLIRP